MAQPKKQTLKQEAADGASDETIGV